MNSKEINKIILAVLFCFFTLNSALPQVAINTNGAQPNTRSILDVASTTLGVLLPRMTEAQRTAITSPPQGLLVFQIDGGANAGLYYATGEGSNWTLIFHSNTTAITGNGSTNYIPYWTGTNALAFTGMYWDNTNSRLGIGTTTPTAKLDVSASGEALRLVGDNNFLTFYNSSNTVRTAYIQQNAGTNLDISTNGLPLILNQNDGNVGIGTTTPTTKLDVNGSITSTAVSIRRASSAPSVGDASNIQFINTGVGYYDLIQGGSAAGMQFFSYVGGWTERMRIASSGNVGIGTTTPAYKLDISSGDATSIRLGPNAYSSRSLLLGGWITNDFSEARIQTSDGNLHLDSKSGNAIYLNTYHPGDVYLAKGGGKVGIGIDPTHLLHLNGGAYCDGTTWASGSDARLKRDIQPMTGYGLSTVMQLKPVTYFYKADKTNHPEVGFIAQEVQKIVPEVVSGIEGDIEKGETLGLSYGNLVPVLTKAIQEQQSEIEDLKTKNKGYEERLSKLERNNQTADNAGFGGNISNIVIVLFIGIGVALFYYRKTNNNFNNKHIQ